MNDSGKEFVEFWDWAIAKGLMKKNTAKALATACRQVLSIDEDWETKNISSLDVDGIINRFINLRSMNVTPEVLNTYARRFKQAVQLFIQYSRDPSDWKPRVQTSSNPKPKATKFDRIKNSQGSQDTSETAVSDEKAFTSPPLVEYPFPLRDNCIIRLKLPSDLKVAEVQRLAAFMQALALDFTPSRTM